MVILGVRKNSDQCLRSISHNRLTVNYTVITALHLRYPRGNGSKRIGVALYLVMRYPKCIHKTKVSQVNARTSTNYKVT